MCRTALEKFRHFLHQQRGQPYPPPRRPLNRAVYCAGLPDWLVDQLERYQRLRQSHWRPSRSNAHLLRFWGVHTRLWRWLCARYAVTQLADIRRQYLLDYVDHRLAEGRAASTINMELRSFHEFLLYLQDRGYDLPAGLRHLPSLKQPESLPKFLTDTQIGQLRAHFEQAVAEAQHPPARREAVLTRAAFYLLWHAGLRLGEVEDLTLDDLDLVGRKLMVRQGKGQKDRTVYLTDTVVRAVQDYLAVRGPGSTRHVCLYRAEPLCKDLLRARLKAAGQQLGLPVQPHRLRHTCATQLLNAGCRVTSIQKFLGHQRLNSTMIYARVHDRTVAEDYYAAMAQVEQRLDVAPVVDAQGPEPVAAGDRAQWLEWVTQLAEPELSTAARLGLVEQLRQALQRAALDETQPNENGREPRPAPSPSPASVGAGVV